MCGTLTFEQIATAKYGTTARQVEYLHSATAGRAKDGLRAANAQAGVCTGRGWSLPLPLHPSRRPEYAAMGEDAQWEILAVARLFKVNTRTVCRGIRVAQVNPCV